MAGQFCATPLRLPVARRGDKTPILFHSQVAWDTVWQRPQEQALGLARHRPVVFLAPVQLHELAGRLLGRWRFARRLQRGRLLVLSPVIFSGEYRNRAVRALNRTILTSMIGRVMGRAKFYFLTNSPFSGALLDHIAPERVLVDLIDDFCAFNWAPPEGRRQEARLLRAASHVFTGTGYLRDMTEGRTRAPVEFLPSGVRAGRLRRPMEEPEDLRALPRPRLLYVGTLNDRVDPALFAEAARAAAGGSVAVVGPRHDTFPSAGLPRNVHLLGLKPHDQLAGYYQHCDLGLMPFADSPAARAINPIKTLEYLACGLPVLSTPIPDVMRYYADVVTTAGPGQWRAAIGRLLDGDTPAARQRRRHFARERSWDRLVDAMEARIRTLEEAGARQ